MASTKVTFTLDQATMARLEEAAARLAMPKSQVVREAILEYCDRIGWLSERERLSLLRTVSAKLYCTLRRPRGREIDLAIAACAISRQAQLWTLNGGDFTDIPDLRLW
jgi:predicted nucleic acid-binding protein